MAEKQWTPRVFNGGMNTDTDIRAVEPPYPNGDYLDSLNTRLSAINNGFHNSRVTVKGNVEVPNEYLPDGDNKSLGAFEDRDNNRIFVFNHNSEGNHGIYLYQDDIWRKLVVGEELAFYTDHKITGVDVINGLLYWVDGKFNPNTKQIEGNTMRMLNIAKADDYQKRRRYNVYFQEEDILNPAITFWQCFITIYNPEGIVSGPVIMVYPTGSTMRDFLQSLATEINDATGRLVAVGCDCHLELELTSLGEYTILFNLFKTEGITTTSQTLAVPENFYPSPVKDEYIDRVKWAPLELPTARFGNDPEYSQNYVAKKYFQFATQYVYDNNEYSCLSPISPLTYARNYCGTDVDAAPNNYVEINFYDERLNNADSLSIIKNVNIYVRYGYLGEWRLVKTLERCDFNLSTSLERRNIFRFYNDGNYPVQAPELVQVENYSPITAIGQAMAQNRGYVGGTKEGYDNVDCVDTDNELTYDEPCEAQTGTITFRVFIRNITEGVAWAGKNYQPIMGTDQDDIAYGGLSASTYENTQVQSMFQDLFLRGFVVYSAQDPEGLNVITEQTAPAGVTLLPGEGNIYDRSGSLTNVRAACVAGQVYSTATVTWPVGKHIVRIAGNLLSTTLEYFNAYPSTFWPRTSLPIKKVGDTAGSVTSYGSECLVDLSVGDSITIDIEVLDCTSLDEGLWRHNLVTGYLFDTEGADDSGALQSAPNPERQLITQNVLTPGSLSAPLYTCFQDSGVTDHNGFFFILYQTPAPGTNANASIKITGANAQDAVSVGDSFYDGSLNQIYTGGLVPVSQLTIDMVGAYRYDYIMYNHYEAYSNNCRTNIEGRAINSNGLPMSGVGVLATLSNRKATTDGEGAYKLLVYADRTLVSDEQRNAAILFKTLSSCCITYPNGENLNVVVTPFTPGGDYSIDYPYTVGDFVLDINEFDVNLWLKHRNMVQWGIVYMDKQGRRGRVNPAKDLFIPFMTDTNGNFGRPVWKWLIRHQPPEWAVKYQIVRTINPLYNRYLQFIIGDIQYVKLWDYSTTPPTAITTTFEAGDATEISMSLLPIINYQQENTGSVLSYIPEKGDRMTFIRDQDGNPYLDFKDFEIQSRGVGTFEDPISAIIAYNSALPELEPGTLIELYTPKKQVDKAFYYEFGQVWDIVNPGEADRAHGGGYNGENQDGVNPATGYVTEGDSFVKNRRMFVLDGTEPNYYEYSVEDEYIYDDDINSRQQNIGIPNISDPDYRQYDYVGRIRFSGLFNVDGNKLFNGLSTFEQSAYGDCDVNFGPVQRLVRIGEQFEILAIQSHKVQPIYINKALLYEYNLSNGTLSANDSPLNFGIPFKSPYGTQHPESVVADGNKVWAYDMFESVIWLYASGDLIPISEVYRIKKKVDELSDALSYYNQNRVHVNGGLDRYNREVIWAFESVTAVDPITSIGGGNQQGGDTGQDGVGNPGARQSGGELQDFSPVTLVYSTKRERWETRLNYYPEVMVPLGGIRSFGFKNGQMWEANINPVCCNFFGVQYTGVIQIVANPNPRTIKDWYALREKSNGIWAVKEVEMPPNNRYPNGMKSRVTKNNFRNFEGDWWAQFFKDMTDPAFATQLEALQRGRELKGDVLIITLENVDTEQVFINEIDINFTASQETI